MRNIVVRPVPDTTWFWSRRRGSRRLKLWFRRRLRRWIGRGILPDPRVQGHNLILRRSSGGGSLKSWMESEMIKLILVAQWSKGIIAEVQQILLAFCALIAMCHWIDMLGSRIVSRPHMILTFLIILTKGGKQWSWSRLSPGLWVPLSLVVSEAFYNKNSHKQFIDQRKIRKDRNLTLTGTFGLEALLVPGWSRSPFIGIPVRWEVHYHRSLQLRFESDLWIVSPT